MATDLVTLLLFTVPGFFFLKTLGVRKKSDFEYLMYSIPTGIMLMVVFGWFIPFEKLDSYTEVPHAGSVLFTLMAIALGFLLKQIGGLLNDIRRRWFV